MFVKLIKLVTHNWHIKLLSLALAAVLWVYVDNLKAKEMFLSVPLQLRNVPSHHIVTGDIPETIKVVLKGKESSLSLVTEDSLEAYVDFEGRTQPRSRNIIKVDKKNLPRGLTVKEINPAFVEADIEIVQRKTVRVIPIIYENPPFGYQLEDVEVNPETVDIEGPVSLVQKIESVYTEDINVSGLRETTVKEVKITLENDKITLVDENTVNVKAIVKEVYVVKRVEEIPIVPLHLKEGLRALLSESSVSALVKLPQRLEKSMEREMMVAVVECGDIHAAGLFHMPVTVETKMEGASVINFEPLTVEVSVMKNEVPRINL
jgi:YbbR domain-containing protein